MVSRDCIVLKDVRADHFGGHLVERPFNVSLNSIMEDQTYRRQLCLQLFGANYAELVITPPPGASFTAISYLHAYTEPTGRVNWEIGFNSFPVMRETINRIHAVRWRVKSGDRALVLLDGFKLSTALPLGIPLATYKRCSVMAHDLPSRCNADIWQRQSLPNRRSIRNPHLYT